MSWLGRLRAMVGRGSAPTRAELIDHKHRLEGEIRQLNRRVNAGVTRGDNVGRMQARLERLRSEHLETRHRIDRTP